MDELKFQTKTTYYIDVVNDALALYKWTIKQKKNKEIDK
jgi:hypothetical protein